MGAIASCPHTYAYIVYEYVVSIKGKDLMVESPAGVMFSHRSTMGRDMKPF